MRLDDSYEPLIAILHCQYKICKFLRVLRLKYDPHKELHVSRYSQASLITRFVPFSQRYWFHLDLFIWYVSEK